MRNALILGLVVSLATTAMGQVSVAKAEDKKPPKLPSCFIMGSPIYFTVKADTPEGPVYFCCDGCFEPFEKGKESGKWKDHIEAQRVALAKLPKVQTACPISGNPVSADAPSIDHKGTKVAFCCGGCKGKFEAEPAKYTGKLAGAFTYQTKCPISGNPIDPAASVELVSGDKVYACCNGCAGKIKAEPSKYAKALAKQGYYFKKDQLKAK